MENHRLIFAIKSKYILMHILSYSYDKNIQLKLFEYSKLFQNRLKISFANCKQNYLEEIGFDLNNYLYKKTYEETSLEKKYNKFISESKLNREKLQDIIYDIVNNEEERKIKEDYEIKINIDSPLFGIISKSNNFENNYTIYISQDEINEEYKNIFNQLNQKRIKYTSIYYRFKEKKAINDIKKLNIDFNKIKRMTIFCNEEEVLEYNNIINKCFFDNLFSTENIKNNLIYLKIYSKCFIKPIYFEDINNFKSLQYLYLHSCKFNKKFSIKLNSLKLLSCDYCKNIDISADVKNLKEFQISYNPLIDFNILLKAKFDKLEILNLNHNKISDISIFGALNFKELKKLYLFNNNISDLNALKNANFEKLEKLDLECNIIDINTLKNASFKELKKLN